MADHSAAVAAAQKVLDDFMAAFNARDIPAFEATFNFPSVRLASNTLVTLNRGDMKPERFTTGALAQWDHSAWERRNVIHAGADKVHIDTRFNLRHHLRERPLGREGAVFFCTVNLNGATAWRWRCAGRGGLRARR